MDLSFQLTSTTLAMFIPTPAGKGAGDHVGIVTWERIKEWLNGEGNIPVQIGVDSSTLTTATNIVNTVAGTTEKVTEAVSRCVPWYLGGKLVGRLIDMGEKVWVAKEQRKATEAIANSTVEAAKQNTQSAQHLSNTHHTFGFSQATCLTTENITKWVATTCVVIAAGHFTKEILRNRGEQSQRSQTEQKQAEEHRKQEQIQTTDAIVLGQLRRGECGDLSATDAALLRHPEAFKDLQQSYNQCAKSTWAKA